MINWDNARCWVISVRPLGGNMQEMKLKVKAHSTRAIGPSWALYKGASMKSILDAADWSKESTFTQFYLIKLDVEVLKQ